MRYTQTEPRLSFSVRGEGEPVLLIMGLGMAGDVWEPQIRLLQDRYRLIWFDNRGTGHSAQPRGPLSMHGLAQDARRVLDAAGVERAHVVGVSMGGMIAQQLALMDHERVHTLSLIATHAGGLGALLPTPRGLRYFLRAQYGKPSARVRALSRLLYTDVFLREASPSTVGERFQIMSRTAIRRRVILAQLGAVMGHDTRSKLSRLKCPTLVLLGRQDVLIRPRTTQALAEGVRHARLVELSPAGHGLIFERARDVASELARHFVAHPLAQPAAVRAEPPSA